MNQLNWIYLDDQSNKFPVGLLHGEQSGHLLVHVAGKIVIIDFQVFDAKSYSFFIGPELCEISVEKEEGKYAYRFVTDNKANTPLNQHRRRESRKDLIKSLLLFGSLIIVIILSTLLFLHYN